MVDFKDSFNTRFYRVNFQPISMCEINHDRALPGGSSKLEVLHKKEKKKKQKELLSYRTLIKVY